MNPNVIMRKKSVIVAIALFVTVGGLFLFQNCAKTKIGDLKDDTSATQQALALLNGKQLLAVSNANDVQCPSGGKVYSVYTDDNSNFQLDPEEPVLSSQTVCNGATGSTGAAGQNGSNAMISMNRVTVELNACVSRSGVQLSSGVDTNKNNTLDASEITHTEVVCDGAAGEPGASGPAGANGHNAVFSITPALAAICPNGGVVILMALDIEDKGIYSAALPQQQSATICNGANGMSAAASPYQIVDVIRPCGITVSNKEVLLRLQNGHLLATVSDNVNGYNTRLAFVVDGNYVNTDPSACSFSISTQGKTRSISWSGAVQSSWQMP